MAFERVIFPDNNKTFFRFSRNVYFSKWKTAGDTRFIYTVTLVIRRKICVSGCKLCKMKRNKKNTLRIQMSYVNTGTRNNFIATAKTRAKIKSRKTYLIFVYRMVCVDGGG